MESLFYSLRYHFIKRNIFTQTSLEKHGMTHSVEGVLTHGRELELDEL